MWTPLGEHAWYCGRLHKAAVRNVQISALRCSWRMCRRYKWMLSHEQGIALKAQQLLSLPFFSRESVGTVASWILLFLLCHGLLYRSLVINVCIKIICWSFLLTPLKSPGQRKEDQMDSSEVFRKRGEAAVLFCLALVRVIKCTRDLTNPSLGHSTGHSDHNQTPSFGWS